MPMPAAPAPDRGRSRPWRPPAWLWWLAGGALCWLLVASGWLPPAWTAPLGPVVADDILQPRLDTAPPAPRGETALQQSFVPRWDGLQELSLLLVRWPGEQEGRLTLRLLDDAGQTVATESVDSAGVVHNQQHTFRFSPQAHAAGRRYVLTLSGDATNPLSAWGYSQDVLVSGALTVTGGETVARDLRLTTRYRLTWRDALAVLGTVLGRQGAHLLLALAVLALPGCLLLLLWDRGWPRWDPAAFWGAAVALGAAAWPLLWLGMSLAGGRWSGPGLWSVAAAGWAVAGWLAWRRRAIRRRVDRGDRLARRDWPALLLLLLLLALGLAVRLLAVRDITIPPWVDASRHGLITAVMINLGQVPADYQPYLPVTRFPYHYGFHALAASVGMMSDWPLPDLLLYLGQLLNGLTPLTVYAAAWLLTRRRAVGLAAAFLVALPFLFPGYYATWGRFTQLTAVLLLPVLLALTWLLVGGGRAWRRAWPLVGVLAAGLFLVHVRVFLYYLPLAGLVWLAHGGRRGRRLAQAAGLGAALAAPRLVQLWRASRPTAEIGAQIAGYNAFPVAYVQAGWEAAFLWLAGAGLLLALAAGLRRRAWSRLPLTLAAWVGTLFLLLAGRRLGLPETTLVNLNSMYIILFVPLALFLSVALARAWRRLAGRAGWAAAPRPAGRLLRLLAGGAVAAALLFGVAQQVDILNPETILARPADREGLVWAEAHLSPSAVVAVNSWLWLGSTWAGSDGGAWLAPLTGRRSTTPPADYIYEPALAQQVTAFNRAAEGVTDWADPAGAAWLRSQGVTHVFVGARGGFFDPAALAANPALEMIYGQDGVFIFRVSPP